MKKEYWIILKKYTLVVLYGVPFFWVLFFTSFESKSFVLTIIFGLFSIQSLNRIRKKQLQKKGVNLGNTQTYIEMERHLLVCGGSGSGKSEFLKLLIESQANENRGCMLYDMKPELTDFFITCYKNKNITSKILRLHDITEETLRINPIHPDHIEDNLDVRLVVQSLVGSFKGSGKSEDDFFSNNAEILLSAVIIYLRNNLPSMCTLSHAISLMLNGTTEQIIKLISSDNEARMIGASIISSKGAEKQLLGIFSSLQTHLSLLSNPSLFWVVGKNEFTSLDVNSKDNLTNIIVQNKIDKKQVYSPILAIFITQYLRKLNVPKKEKYTLLLDEAPTIYISDIDIHLATCRSNQLSIVYSTQDLGQIKERHGEKSNAIIANCGTQYYGRTTNTDTIEKISMLSGNYEKRTSGTNIGMTGAGANMGMRETKRINTGSFTNLYPGEFYEFSTIHKQQMNKAQKTKRFPQAKTKEEIQDYGKAIEPKVLKEFYNNIVNETKQILET